MFIFQGVDGSHHPHPLNQHPRFRRVFWDLSPGKSRILSFWWMKWISLAEISVTSAEMGGGRGTDGRKFKRKH